VDKYGRKLKKDEGKRLANKFYHLEDENESEDSEESEESEESDEESEEEVDEQEEVTLEEDIPRGDATYRLAAVNLDWDNVRAVDILAVLQSFIPGEGRVNKVTIYPSEFGKVRIGKETVEGPSIFQDKKEDGEVDTVLLRKYQLERLRYYYAIVECSSVQIANSLYKALDGAELGSTANILDLRFVPDNVSFDDEPKDQATDVPDDHEPAEFVTDALQHSKPKLTWDGEDPERKRLVSKAFTGDSENGKWDALLASSEDEEEDSRDKYRELLLGNNSTGFDEKDEQDEVDVEFPEDQDEDTVNEEDETTLEKYKRKQRERKQRKRQDTQPSQPQNDNLGFNDPFFQSPSTKKKKSERAKQADPENTKELDLLMHEDESTNHFNINHILKSQKSKKQKKTKRSAEKEMELQSEFKMNVHDPRFSDIYTGGEFAIDPNNPAYKKGLKGMEALLQESRRQKRGIQEPTDPKNEKRRKRK
jgi:NUC153 domain